MVVRNKNGLLYADSQADLPDVLRDFSEQSYPATQFADAVCDCRSRTFRLAVDEREGAAVRTCTKCGDVHPIGDSSDYLEGAELESCECICDSTALEITVGVALYAESDDVCWLYIGGRCPECKLSGCYGDWKSEYAGFRDLLERV